MITIPHTRLLDTAVRAAKAAGKHALENKHRRTEVNEQFDHDVKLVLDVECQHVVEEVVTAAFPDHGILGEEGESINPDSDYEWIIDPIDGTVNFTHGNAYWCCSVAVRRGDEIVAGCVYAPEYDKCFTACIDGPAQCNGKPIRVSETAKLEEAMILTGLSKHLTDPESMAFDGLRQLAVKTQKLRINGAAALDMCQVAAGSCDGSIEGCLFLWDHAAAGLIAQRAGAKLKLYPEPEELHRTAVLCANEHLIDELDEIYNRSFSS